MLKTKDLQIGDWVKGFGGPNKITVIKESCFAVTEKGGHAWSYNNKYEPIELTDDILRLNGGKEEDDTDSTGARYEDWSFEGYEFNCLNCTKEEDGYKFSLAKDTPYEWSCYKTCKYVHELQHILRIIGFDDLAKNWKV